MSIVSVYLIITNGAVLVLKEIGVKFQFLQLNNFIQILNITRHRDNSNGKYNGQNEVLIRLMTCEVIPFCCYNAYIVIIVYIGLGYEKLQIIEQSVRFDCKF